MQAKKRKQTRINNNFPSSVLFFILTIALFFVYSCSEKTQVPAPVQPKKKVSTSIDAAKQSRDNASVLKTATSGEPYTYNPSGKLDPFVSSGSESTDEEVSRKKIDDAKPVQEVPITPLQKLAVDDFVLVAVISTPKGLCALIEDPSMNGFTIKEGMQIGRKAGVVKKILGNSVIIEEQNDAGQESSERKITTLTLRKK